MKKGGVNAGATPAAAAAEEDARFEDFLCARNDELDNAVHDLLCLMLGRERDDLQWDISLIGEFEDFSNASCVSAGSTSAIHSTRAKIGHRVSVALTAGGVPVAF